MSKASRERWKAKMATEKADHDARATVLEDGDPRIEPDWKHKCEVCGAKPTVPLTGMCGPCTWGDAETAGGNW